MLSRHRNLIGTALTALVILGGAASASAQGSAGIPVASAPADASGDARAPYAWTDFCKRSPMECRTDTREPERIEMTAKLWKTIVATNNSVTGTGIVSAMRALQAEGGGPAIDIATNVDGGGSSQMFVQGRGQVITSRNFGRGEL